MNSLTVGLGSVVGAVVHNELAGSDLALQGLVLVLGEGLEVPAVISSGQTNIVAILQTEVTVGSSDVAPLAGLDVARAVLTDSEHDPSCQR